MKPLVNPLSPATDDVTRDLVGRAGIGDGVVLQGKTPFGKLKELIAELTDLIEWFRTTDVSCQKIFLLKYLSTLDYPLILYICVELEKLAPALPEPVMSVKQSKIPKGKSNKTPPVKTPEPVKQLEPEVKSLIPSSPDPNFSKETFLDLSGVGVVTLHEKNIFCSQPHPIKLFKCRRNVPQLAASMDVVAIKSPESPAVEIHALHPRASKASPFQPLATVRTPGDIPVIRMTMSSDGVFLFIQTGPTLIQSFHYKDNRWDTGKHLTTHHVEESFTYVSTNHQSLTVGTSQTRVAQWNPKNDVVEFSIKPSGHAWKDDHPVTKVCVHKQVFCCFTVGRLGILVASLHPSTKSVVRKIFNFNSRGTIPKVSELTCNAYFCVGAAGRNAYVWEVWNGHSLPKRTMAHQHRICGMTEYMCRVVTGCTDGSINVWHLLTGEMLTSFRPLPDIGHPLLSSIFVSMDTVIMSFVTALYVVHFGDGQPIPKISLQKTRQDTSGTNAAIDNGMPLRVTSSVDSLEMVNHVEPAPETPSNQWHRRLMSLLNKEAAKEKKENKTGTSCAVTPKRTPGTALEKPKQKLGTAATMKRSPNGRLKRSDELKKQAMLSRKQPPLPVESHKMPLMRPVNQSEAKELGKPGAAQSLREDKRKLEVDNGPAASASEGRKYVEKQVELLIFQSANLTPRQKLIHEAAAEPIQKSQVAKPGKPK
ncbi:hypothetical protein RvY_01410 [Ramazzottius varieornatus]|uniref:Uncharacterized protein n=1 Tax=Ramazzottius varieornatus TaxID=947166 RepID=A0A1D1UG78_RAMVA|nr:hypothetical protein RvY_01410 [Ramazzottius varieornatus]